VPSSPEVSRREPATAVDLATLAMWAESAATPRSGLAGHELSSR